MPTPKRTALIALLYVAKMLGVFAVKYTILPVSPMAPGVGGVPIRIMEAASHAAILDEIKTRWRGRLKQLHGGINFANDVEKEIAKFSWMKRHAIITEGEYREAVDMLRAYALHSRPPAADHGCRGSESAGDSGSGRGRSLVSCRGTRSLPGDRAYRWPSRGR